MKEPLEPSDPLASIEERLQRLTAAPLPTGLVARLDKADPARTKVVQHAWRWISLAAAASIALGAWIAATRERNMPPPVALKPAVTPESLRVYTPVSSRNLLLSARDIGIYTPLNSPPVRLVRCTWLDDATYRASDGGSDDLQVTRTHEQIIPIALTVY